MQQVTTMFEICLFKSGLNLGVEFANNVLGHTPRPTYEGLQTIQIGRY
jgi:hypothetical protein